METIFVYLSYIQLSESWKQSVCTKFVPQFYIFYGKRFEVFWLNSILSTLDRIYTCWTTLFSLSVWSDPYSICLRIMLDSGSHFCSRSISHTHTHTTSATLPSDSICPACSLCTLHLHTIQQTLQTNEFHSVFLSFSFIFPIVFELKCVLNQWACTLNFPQQHIYLFASLIFMDFISFFWLYLVFGLSELSVLAISR